VAGNSTCGKAISIICCESVSALLVIQHLTRMRRIILSSVACLFLNIFPHYLINITIIGKKITEHNMCVLIFSTTLSDTFLIIRRTERDNITMYIGLHVMYPLSLSDVNED
jgi:hypothetical protein